MNKTPKQRKIMLNAAVQKAMCAEFGVSRVNGYNALRYANNSDVAKKMREYALAHGGIEVELPIV